jgi:hypothetical protein
LVKFSLSCWFGHEGTPSSSLLLLAYASLLSGIEGSGLLSPSVVFVSFVDLSVPRSLDGSDTVFVGSVRAFALAWDVSMSHLFREFF